MFKDRLKKIFTDSRVIIVLLVVLLGLIAINPQFNAAGVTIRNVVRDSPAYNAGVASAVPNSAPTSKDRIVTVNSVKIASVEQYYQLIKMVPENTTVSLTTNKGKVYNVLKGAADDIGISVYAAPQSNIRLGLDLQGGTRVILQPAEVLTPDQLDSLITSMTQRLNVYGLSDISVRGSTDLSGNQFIVVEIAGANEEEVKELLSHQGKFEAKIGNATVFKGGNDITYVCKTAECSGIDPTQGCGVVQGGYSCRFRFSISLTSEAAQRQADISSKLSVVPGQSGQQYLNETLDLLLDDVSVENLNIGSDLKGRAATDIEISGAGTGVTQAEAQAAALANMKKLQTVLITGSLPVKINIVKTDTISPTLGEAFTKNALFVSFVALLVVAAIIFIRYKRWEIIVPMLVIAWIEIFLTLAIAALIGWNLDVPSIAGIIISIGQGVNDQIVITDEILAGNKDDEEETSYSWKKKLAKAFFIVFAAYFASMGAMVTLLFAGAGLLRGFAITSIIGYTIGVVITRPAYSRIIEVLLEKEN